jgi:hypothetical protein
MEAVLAITLVFAQYILAVILCAQYTTRHGRGPALGAVLGVFFGWFALLGLALMLTDDAPAQYMRHHLPSPAVRMASQLERLAELYRRGALTYEEYDTEKRTLLTR